MGLSHEYSNVPDWVEKPEGYKTDEMVKYEGNVFIANFWASKPGEGEADKNGWRLYDELYDVTSSPATDPARIIGYIPTWRKKEGFDYANKEIYRNVTHGVISFLMFSETDLGEFEPTSVNDVDAIFTDVVLTGHECGTYISIALGGATDYGFLYLMERIGNNPGDPVLQKAVKNVVDFVENYGLDGVDLDLECWWDKNSDPNKDQGGRLKSNGAHPAGKGLTEFARQLKRAMPDKIISAALFATSWYGNCYDPGLAEYVDWLGIMTYDLTGSWNQSPVGPQTALLKSREQKVYAEEQQGEWPGNQSSGNATDPMSDNPILSVEDSLWYWTNPFFTNWQGKGQNLKRNKIAAGVPIYGYDFAYGKEPDDLSGQIAPGYKVIRYKDLLSQFPDAHTAVNANIKVPGNTPRPPFVSAAGTYPYAHNIYFETPKSATDKLNFLKSVGAQGVIIWELSNDVWEEEKSIIKALYKNSGNLATRPALPSKIKPKPEPEPSLTFPREWIGVFPGEWSESVQIFSSKSLESRGTEESNKKAIISGSPAVAVFQNKLYVVFEGGNNDGWLYYSAFDGNEWSKTKLLGNDSNRVSGSPALVVYKDKLYCVHAEVGETGWLRYCTFDGQKWTDSIKLGNHGTSLRERRYPCASLAVHKEVLYCVHEGYGSKDGKGWLWYCTFDGKWSKDEKLPNHGTIGTGGLAVVEETLICVHEGKDGSGVMWYTSFDDLLGANEWNEDRELVLLDAEGKKVKCHTSGPPGVVTDGNKLYSVHEGSGNDGSIWTFNNESRQDAKLIAVGTAPQLPVGTSGPPALAKYNSEFYIVHQGTGNDGQISINKTTMKKKKEVKKYVYAIVHDGRGDFIIGFKNRIGWFFHTNGGVVLTPPGQRLNGGDDYALPGGELGLLENSVTGAWRELFEETNEHFSGWRQQPEVYEGREPPNSPDPLVKYYGVYLNVGNQILPFFASTSRNLEAGRFAALAASRGEYQGDYNGLRAAYNGCPQDNELKEASLWGLRRNWQTIQQWQGDPNKSWYYHILNNLRNKLGIGS